MSPKFYPADSMIQCHACGISKPRAEFEVRPDKLHISKNCKSCEAGFEETLMTYFFPKKAAK